MAVDHITISRRETISEAIGGRARTEETAEIGSLVIRIVIVIVVVIVSSSLSVQCLGMGKQQKEESAKQQSTETWNLEFSHETIG